MPYNTYAQPYQNIFLTSIEVVNAIILFIRRFALNKLLPNESSYWTGSAFNWKYSEIKFFISCFPLPSLSTTHSPVFPILFYIILKHIGSWDESCKHEFTITPHKSRQSSQPASQQDRFFLVQKERKSKIFLKQKMLIEYWEKSTEKLNSIYIGNPIAEPINMVLFLYAPLLLLLLWRCPISH